MQAIAAFLHVFIRCLLALGIMFLWCNQDKND